MKVVIVWTRMCIAAENKISDCYGTVFDLILSQRMVDG
jgi:hypothetical protein